MAPKKPSFPLPPDLPMTLAARVRVLRERRDFTPNQLALACHLPLATVEDIEAGIEVFLSHVVRNKLCRVFRVPLSVLKDVELDPEYFQQQNELRNDLDKIRIGGLKGTAAKPSVNASGMDFSIRRIRQDIEAEWPCPKCGAKLNIRAFERMTPENDLIQTLKIHCSQCLFRTDWESAPILAGQNPEAF